MKYVAIHDLPVSRPFPMIICLCGSTRFHEMYVKKNLELTCSGHIVLTIGADFKSDEELFKNMGTQDLMKLKAKLDVLHLRKIDMCNYIYVLNVGGYIGESTAREIAYAESIGKAVVYLEGAETSRPVNPYKVNLNAISKQP